MPYINDPDFALYVGDVRDVLAKLPSESVDCCVTSPPYWGLRNYGHDAQIGLEDGPDEYVAAMVGVFREVRRVLTKEGTLWLNLGDSYNSAASNQRNELIGGWNAGMGRATAIDKTLKPKDLVGIPWRVAFALQADGWYLRSDIIWAKSNPMPESVTDRPTKAHEYVFLLSKSPRYFFDAEAVKEPAEWARWGAQNGAGKYAGSKSGAAMVQSRTKMELQKKAEGSGRNVRSVWEIATQPYAEAHFATFPEALPERCIKAGCPEQVCATCGKARERIVGVTRGGTSDREGSRFVGAAGPRGTNFTGKALGSDTRGAPSRSSETLGWTDCGHDNYRTGVVLDPFMGSGTTALVARRLGRKSVGIELNPEYADLAARRLQQLSLLAEGAA